MIQRRLCLTIFLFVSCLQCTLESGWAQEDTSKLKLPSFFSNNMVLQRDKPISIWGWAKANTKVDVVFLGNTSTATSDPTGKWKVKLPALAAHDKGSSLVVESDPDRIEVKNVLVGEVWFASGQSNMAFLLQNSLEGEQDVAASNHPGIRMYLAANTAASEPQSDIRGQWHVSTPETSGPFSAVAYFFALRLHEETGVPVGVIKSCIGGKRAECYTSREAMLSNEHGKKMIAELDQQAAKYDPVKSKAIHEKRLAEWKEKTVEVREFNKGKDKADRKRVPRQPRVPTPVYENEGNPTVLYNGMIHPFVGYTMRGAVWYQGEANARPGFAEIYQDIFTLMIKDWRTRWGDDFAFYFVQLANYKDVTTEPGVESDWATVQNLQRKTLELPGTGMATINDVGAAKDIHPKDKKTVGNRLALWALNQVHGQKRVVSGPLYKSHQVNGDHIVVQFDHVGGGLKSRDDKPLQRFEISGADKKWHWASAAIKGNTVVVSSPDVSTPIAVRYAWAPNPEGANLGNVEGLPASIFKTE